MSNRRREIARYRKEAFKLTLILILTTLLRFSHLHRNTYTSYPVGNGSDGIYDHNISTWTMNRERAMRLVSCPADRP